jgi:predicted DNA-binding WGR domain protein
LLFDYPRSSDFNTKNSILYITPLLYAIRRQNFKVCKFLLETLNFDINCSNINQESPLVYAIKMNNIDLIRLLFDSKYEVEKCEDDANTHNPLSNFQKVIPNMNMLFQTQTENADDDEEDEEMASDYSEEEKDEEEEEEEGEDEEEEEDNTKVQTNGKVTIKPVEFEKKDNESSFKLTSNIRLNTIDRNSRTIFHHLADNIAFGSLNNIPLYNLLIKAYNLQYQQQQDKKQQSLGEEIKPVKEFLQRIDHKLMTASKYAIKSGNIKLYHSLEAIIDKQNDSPVTRKENEMNLLSKFNVNDPLYDETINNKFNFKNDSNSFLRTFEDTQTEQKNGDKKTNNNEYFKVDPLSKMDRIGELVIDKNYNIPYDVILTKTDVTCGYYGMHNFYKMQLIIHSYDRKTAEQQQQQQKNDENGSTKPKSEESTMCVLFTRWGRIGEVGQCQRTPYPSRKEAKIAFWALFKQKTGNDFVETVVKCIKPFETKAKRYSLIKLESRMKNKLKDIDFTIINNNDDDKWFSESRFGKLINENHSTNYNVLEYKKLWRDLLNVDFLKKQYSSSGTSQISAEYLPLTQLSLGTLEQATELLTRQLKPAIERRMELEKLNKKKNLVEFMQLLEQINQYSNQYYELIPQNNYNYEKLSPIDTENALEGQMRILTQLSNTQFACRMLMAAKYASTTLTVNPIDYIYSLLNVKLGLLDPTCMEAQYIIKYALSSSDSNINTNNVKHRTRRANSEDINIKRIFKFDRQGEQERLNSFLKTLNDEKNEEISSRYLLWHGTSTENMLSIMSRGLLKAPHDAKHNGQMFGRAIYFSDSFKVSTNYASYGPVVEIDGSKYTSHYMLLCEVALGNVKEIYESTEGLPLNGYDSVKALGNLEPDEESYVSIPNGAKLPLGPLVEAKKNKFSNNTLFNACRRYVNNQYMIYNESQCCIRYIVQYYKKC